MAGLSVGGIDDLSFTLRAGEVLGVAALEGQGQDELFAVLSGQRSPSAGEIRVAGRRWHRIGPAGVGENGRFRRVMSLPRAGRYRLRWRYHGSRNGRWLSAVSASRLITVG